MKTQFTAQYRGRSQVALAISSALVLVSSLAAAQAAPAAAPAAPAAPTAGDPSQPTTLTDPGTANPTGAADATAPAAAAEPGMPAAQPPAGSPGAVDAGAGVTAGTGGEAAEQAEDNAEPIPEDLTDEASKINFYGFADFTYSGMLSSRKTSDSGTGPYPSFYVGNLNLYMDSNLGNKFRSLVELRFTYLPDGAATHDPATYAWLPRTNTAYPDYTDYSRLKKVGGIIIERAWVEYAAHPLFNIRLGQWLTPYGIWNVDHGSPTILGVTRPYIVGDGWLPPRQTGIELYGSWGIDSTQVGYHLTVSNGRGPFDTHMDLDSNKGLGWRLWLRQDLPYGTLTLGQSGYKGRYTDAGITLGANFTNDYPVTSRYDELGLAADLKYTWGGYLLQSELITRQIKYDDAYRPAAMSGGWTPNNRNWGWYVQTGYRLPWLGIMPWIGFEYDHFGKAGFMQDAADVVGGFNIRPTERIVLKLVGLHVWVPSAETGGYSLDQLMAQIAWSF